MGTWHPLSHSLATLKDLPWWMHVMLPFWVHTRKLSYKTAQMCCLFKYRVTTWTWGHWLVYCMRAHSQLLHDTARIWCVWYFCALSGSCSACNSNNKCCIYVVHTYVCVLLQWQFHEAPPFVLSTWLQMHWVCGCLLAPFLGRWRSPWPARALITALLPQENLFTKV